MSGRVKDGSVQGECVHAAEAVTVNSETPAPAASSFSANDGSSLWSRE